MHLAATLSGALFVVWGVIILFAFGMLVDDASLEPQPPGPTLKRWLPHIIVTLLLPLPVGLVLGGGELVRWGYLGG